MTAAVSATTGQRSRSSAEVATSWWVVPAPISIRPPASRMPAKPGTCATSISTAGSLSRSFISGTRLWPPAISLPAPPAAASLASASSMETARWYSKAVGIMRPSSWPTGRE